ncbi:hypothetical protein HNY73_011745 [Argiope bruennichi]|uniref:Uncharacterized protein n=1 Tax=Argiope bruennichi TaxID=94029 RepID=A0A8T0EU89_ARGBR|nr:hypothetical protein HNY73_011745 [Argiope bruennichi]
MTRKARALKLTSREEGVASLPPCGFPYGSPIDVCFLFVIVSAEETRVCDAFARAAGRVASHCRPQILAK